MYSYKMDPSNPKTRSAMTLSRVEQNDPTLTSLSILRRNRNSDYGDYWPNDSAGLSRLGSAIGMNTNIRMLLILRAHELADMVTNDGAFFDGLRRNASIKRLMLASCDLLEGMAPEILNEYISRNSLDTVMLYDCQLGNGGAGAFASAVSRSTNLQNIVISNCNVDDDILVEFISGISGMRQHFGLNLGGNRFGRAGCDALATLLQDPKCNICSLDLSSNNNIDDSCAIILANALRGNTMLERLDLSGNADNATITARGWNAFDKVLCDTSTVNATYLSNHTLQAVTSSDRNIILAPSLPYLLRLNGNTDKKKVAVQKILFFHRHLDMEPFLEWDLKVLPVTIGWFDRARDYYADTGSKNYVSATKLSAIYQFARAVPLMFVPNAKKSGAKRKADELS